MARIVHYDQGDLWRPTVTFQVGGVATDPTTVTARVKDPAGTVTVHGPVSGATGGGSITRVSAGVFRVDVTLNDAGYWFARFEGTGAATATEEHQAIVDPSEFYESAQLESRALVGLAEAKDWLQQQNIDTTNDLELARVINDISNRFHEEAGREFKTAGPTTRTFPTSAMGLYGYVEIGDATSVSAVEILDSDWTTVLETVDTTDWVALPRVRQAWEPIRRIQLNHLNGATYLRAGFLVRVTGVWGFPAIPGDVRQAVLDGVAAVMDRDVEHYRQDLGFIGAQQAQGGTIVMMSGGGQRMLSLPPGSLAVAWRYRDPLIV